MNCEQARLFFPLLAAESIDVLEGERRQDEQVTDHLAHCVFCQRELEKTHKLRALLALKRYEQPDKRFFKNYLEEFHKRLYSSILQRQSVFAKIRSIFELDHRAVWTFRAACGVFVVLALILTFYTLPGVRQNRLAKHGAPTIVTKIGLPGDDLVLRPEQNTVYVLDRITKNADSHGSTVFTF